MPINWSPRLTIDPRENSYGILENIYSIDTRGIEGIIYERLMLYMLIIGPVSRIENCIATYAGRMLIFVNSVL